MAYLGRWRSQDARGFRATRVGDQPEHRAGVTAGLRSPSLSDPQPEPELFVDCPVRHGDRFDVVGTSDAGFELRRATTGDQGVENPLPAYEYQLAYPAEAMAAAGAGQVARQPEPEDLERLTDREQRLQRVGDAVLADLGRAREPGDDYAANWVLQRRINAHYQQQQKRG